MGRKKHIAKLMEHVRRTGSELVYEVVVTENPDPVKRFILRAVIDGEHFPHGLGKNKREAKQNAAKSALRTLSEKENQRPVKSITEPNCVSLFNEYGQKNRLPIKAVETPRLKSRNATPSCSFVVGDKKYPAASGKTKREAKEEAAMLVYQEINSGETTEVSSCSALSEDGEPTRLSSPRTSLEFSDVESKSMATRSDSSIFSNSSNHLNTQDAMISEEINTEKSLGDTTLTEILSNKSEFDSIEPIGKGAFGHVFKARHKLLDECYAIKVVPCKETGKALREVKALSKLNHCNIIRYYSCWMDNTGCQWDSTDDSWSTSQSDSSSASYLYIQMDLCDTKTLRVWIDENNTQSVRKSLRNSKRREESLDIVQQIVDGVEYIHSEKFIHRDLKPANILFGRDGKVKIGDFGLVTTENDHNDKNLMERTVNKGTPSYMAPEQKSEKTYDRKVDIFALGLIYFELLWKISTVHEREGVWYDIRRHTFPKEFFQYYDSECIIIRSMLNVKPEDRPEAITLKTKLEEVKHMFNTEEIVRRGNRTV